MWILKGCLTVKTLFMKIDTIRCIWGPTLCLFEKIINKFKFDDEKIDMYQRILTYEVDKMHIITEQLIGKALT